MGIKSEVSLKLLPALLFLFCFPGLLTAQKADDFDIEHAPVYRSLDKALKKADYVYKLNLSRTGLTAFPEEIFELKQLRVLVLDTNKITSIPPRIKELVNLEVLSLSHNELSAIPPEIQYLEELYYLYIDQNRITELPPELFRLYNLYQLEAQKNLVKEIPAGIETLRYLHRLYLDDNHIESVANEIWHLNSLEILSMQNNKLTELPPDLYNLKALRALNLTGNNLTSISPDIGRLENLEYLFINKNSLSAFPAEMAGLQKLKYLFMGENPFTEFPPVVNELKGLKKLNLKDLLFQPFPQTLYDIQNNGIEISDSKHKEPLQLKVLLSQARNKKLVEEYDEAIVKYKEILKTDTNNPYAYAEIAETYLDKGEFDSAVAACHTALKKDLPTELVGKIQVTLSNGQNRTNKYDSIIASYRAKIEEAPSKASPLYELGKYYYNQGKNDEALEEFYKAVILDPEYAAPHLYIAVICHELEQEEAFSYSAIRYFILNPESGSAESLLPFLMVRLKMKTGVSDNSGSTKYYDSYVVRDEQDEIIYKSENPASDILMAMILDLTRSQTSGKNKKKNDPANEIIAAVMHGGENNVQIFQSEFKKTGAKNEQPENGALKNLLKYYRPYFDEIKTGNHLETLSYLVNAIRSKEDYITKWLGSNSGKVNEFNTWSKNYPWK